MNCLFCKVLNAEVPAKIAYEDEHVLAFHDINPQAPHHILIIPRVHIASLNELNEDNAHYIGKLTLAAKKLAKSLGIDDKGYRTVMNCGVDGGQTVFHIHMHLLGGRPCTWPPG